MNFNNQLIWTITDGSEGMISQVNGLAKHLSKNILEVKTELIFPWSFFQPGILPVYKWIFKNDFDFSIMPTIAISCGRKSVYTSLFLKKILNKRIVTIHIQNPKINSNNFDYVIAPNHDNFSGNNIYNTTGAIHQFTRKLINECDNDFKIIKGNKLVSVIIGGPNQHYQFTSNEINKLILKIIKLKKNYKNYSFCIIPSRRTQKNIVNILYNELKDIAFVWDKKSKNPYLFSLKNSDFFIVTSDSTSMISECAFTGKPVYVYHLPYKRNSKRIAKFHKEFEEKNITKKISTTLIDWNYNNLNEAERIAGILRTRILNSNINESR